MIRPDLSLSHEDWQTIEKATELLKPFNEFTLEISGEMYVSASKYVVFCKIINRALNKYVPEDNLKIQQLHNSLKVQMQQRFGEIENHTLLCEATILDPRFKKSGFNNPRNFERAASDMKLMIGSERTQFPQESAVEVPVPPQPKLGPYGMILMKRFQLLFLKTLLQPVLWNSINIWKNR